MYAPRSYVVRVYRRNSTGLVGTVQDVRTGRVTPFQAPEELWCVLAGAFPPSLPKRGAARAGADQEASGRKEPVEKGGGDESN